MRGFRLNGWQRIGIVLSVLWFPVGAWWGLNMLYDPLYASHRTCMDLADRGTGLPLRCEQKLYDGLANAREQRASFVALFGLAPIPVVWLAVYLVVWTVRWIRRGFSPAS